MDLIEVLDLDLTHVGIAPLNRSEFGSKLSLV